MAVAGVFSNAGNVALLFAMGLSLGGSTALPGAASGVGSLFEVDDEGDFVAAGELGATVAFVPDLAREGHHIGLFKAEAFKEAGFVAEGEDAVEANLGRFFEGCPNQHGAGRREPGRPP